MAPVKIKPRTGQGKGHGNGRKPNTRGGVERASWAGSSATRTSPATPRPESPRSQRFQGQPSKVITKRWSSRPRAIRTTSSATHPKFGGAQGQSPEVNSSTFHQFKSRLVTTFRKQVRPYCRRSPEEASRFHRRIVPQGMAQHYCDGSGARLLRERGVVFQAKTQRKPTKLHSFHIRPPGLNVATDD